jgi:hypothetical protein
MPKIDIIGTDVDPNYLNQVGLEIFHKWIDFARGRTALGGKTILYPTGRYAASITMRRYGTRRGARVPGDIPTRTVTHIAIIADEKLAPEAAILETGHAQIDMLQHLAPGRAYPIHRNAPTPAGIVSGPDFPRTSYGRAQVRKLWAVSREIGARGYARTPKNMAARGPSNTSGTGPAWTIPAMPAYAPAQILADLVRNYGLQATVS